MKRIRRNVFIAIVALVVGFIAWGFWFRGQLKPMPSGKAFFIRFNSKKPLRLVLTRLAERGVVKNSSALYLYARIKRNAAPVETGTYSFQPGMTAKDVLAAVRKPIRQLLRLPEFYWIKRTGKLLEKHQVAKESEYIAWTLKPQAFQKDVSFPLPKTGSLEGYLYPDTYDLPPLLGAQEVIKKQLQAFEKKVWPNLKKPKQLKRTLTIASMIQLEVAKDGERPIVAGIIENRLKQGMRLQIDATILYAMQKWKSPTHDEIVSTQSPYNTYRNAGLPPGPICSPSVKSILGAENPATHPYLFYVAMPGGKHLFAATLAEHNANIRKRLKALGAGGH